MTDHWHILGAGAIGCLWACWLKERCTLILKPELIDQIGTGNTPEKPFVTIRFEKNGLMEEQKIAVAFSGPEQEPEPIRNLLICTKANQTEEAIRNLNLASNANIVLMQNGMGNRELLEQFFPGRSLYCATTTHGAFRKSRFHVVHAGAGETFIGTIPYKEAEKEITENIAKSLGNDIENIQFDPEMEKRLWTKLAINCAINPLTAIHQCKNGELVTDPEKNRQLEILCAEIDQILIGKGFLEPGQSCAATVKKVAEDTGENFSSMYQDVKNRKASEIDFIQGYLIKEASHLNISVPENEKILQTIKNIESGY